jgi:hypothetical protein
LTTQSWNTPLNHSTDAGFRAWGSEMSAKLAAIGLVQTSDTGQINWATVTRSAANVAAGYEIWRFNDSLQSTSPIFIKLEYGTNGAADRPNVWITVATGSNGAGTLTGQSSTRTACVANAAISSTVTNYQSYACAVDGLAWIANKWLALGASVGFCGFAVCRTCDSSGVPTNIGFEVKSRDTSNAITTYANVQFVRTLSPASSTAIVTTGLFALNVYGLSTTVDGANTQAFLNWAPTPKVQPLVGMCSMLVSEAAFGTTFSTTLVGITPRTYLSIERAIGLGGIGSASPLSLCLIYE